jgi:glycosyltransferase involved in cell wall biosynthesis
MSKKLSIAFLCTSDPNSQDSFSGTPYHLVSALRRHGAAVSTFFLPSSPPPRREIFKHTAYKLFRNRKYLQKFTRKSFRRIGTSFTGMLDKQSFDCVLSFFVEPIGFLETPLPVFLWHDATYPLLIGRYWEYTQLADECLDSLSELETRALTRCRKIFYTSRWAANSAHVDYSVQRERIRVVRVGANRKSTWDTAIAKAMTSTRAYDSCRLLFIGSEWERKGGDTVLRLARTLHATGFAVDVSLVGSPPVSLTNFPGYAHFLGRIPFGDPSSAERFRNLYSAAHFLILPTLGDCTPLVIGEAFSYGLPVLATPAGGIPEMIKHGETGFLSPMTSDAEITAAAQWIRDTFNNRDLAQQMALRCFSESRDYDWDKHADYILNEIELSLAQDSDGRSSLRVPEPILPYASAGSDY